MERSLELIKKRIVTIFTIVMLVLLVGCSTENRTSGENKDISQTASDSKDNTNKITSEEKSGQISSDPDKKVLVVYFSTANNNTADAVSSATPMIDDKGSTEYLAWMIGEKTGAQVSAIIPDEAYPLAYNDTTDKAKQEQSDNARPGFTISVNPEEYDVIFVGYPIWWYEIPMVMETFFDRYALAGKTIIPFNTHLGSRDGGTYSDIAELEPEANVLEGLAVNGEKVKDAEQTVSEWLDKLSY